MTVDIARFCSGTSEYGWIEEDILRKSEPLSQKEALKSTKMDALLSKAESKLRVPSSRAAAFAVEADTQELAFEALVSSDNLKGSQRLKKRKREADGDPKSSPENKKFRANLKK